MTNHWFVMTLLHLSDPLWVCHDTLSAGSANIRLDAETTVESARSNPHKIPISGVFGVGQPVDFNQNPLSINVCILFMDPETIRENGMPLKNMGAGAHRGCFEEKLPPSPFGLPLYDCVRIPISEPVSVFRESVAHIERQKNFSWRNAE